MCKFLCFAVVLLLQCILRDVLADDDNATFRKALEQFVESAVEDCYEDEDKTQKVDMTDEGIEGMLKGLQSDPPRSTKCLRYCVMRKNRWLDEENLLDVDVMVEAFKARYSGMTDGTFVKETLQKCSAKLATESDRCERAHGLTMCILKSGLYL